MLHCLSFIVLSLILGLCPAALAADTSSCISTITTTLPTLTETIKGSTTTWSGQAISNDGTWTTVYETAFPEFCSTGVQLHTYTITEACGADLDCPCQGGKLPHGFASVHTECHTCGPAPITTVLVVPGASCSGDHCVGPEASKGPKNATTAHCSTCSLTEVRTETACSTCGPQPTAPVVSGSDPAFARGIGSFAGLPMVVGVGMIGLWLTI